MKKEKREKEKKQRAFKRDRERKRNIEIKGVMCWKEVKMLKITSECFTKLMAVKKKER